MEVLSRGTRIIAVVAAGILTCVLFSTVVSIAEPQRSALITKNAALTQLMVAKAPAHALAHARSATSQGTPSPR